MKNILKILAVLLFSVLLFNSCEKDDPDLTFGGPYFIAFEDATSSQTESDNSVLEIIAILSAPAQTSTVTVNYTISSPDQSAVQGTDFEVLNTSETLTFAPGVYTDTIFITITDNFVEDGNKSIVLELTTSNVTDFELGLPGDADANKTHVLTVVDDDCALVPENWVGTPAGSETYANWPVFEAAATWKVEEVISDTKVKYLVVGLMDGIFNDWGETITNGGEYYITLDYTNPLDPTVILEAKYASPEGFDDYGYYATTDDTWSYYILQDPDNPSTFSTCNKTLTIYYIVDISTNGGALDHDFRACYYDVTFN